MIGNGTIKQASVFLNEHAKPMGFDVARHHLYTDPTLQSFQAFQLPRGVWATFNPKHWLSMLKTKTELGIKGVAGKVAGDALQQGGTFVLGPGQQASSGSKVEALFAHINQSPGDHADLDHVLQLLRSNPLP